MKSFNPQYPITIGDRKMKSLPQASPSLQIRLENPWAILHKRVELCFEISNIGQDEISKCTIRCRHLKGL